MRIVAVVVLAAAGFALASIASGGVGSILDTTGTSTTGPTTTAPSTVTVTVTQPTTVTVRGPAPKVTICHHTLSKVHAYVTIKVAAASLYAHFRHGDVQGRCTLANVKAIQKTLRNRAHGHR